MTTIFKPTFFQNNRKQLRQACGDTGLIIVAANGLLQRSADTTYQFSQDANFWYLTGLDEPDLLLVMDGEDEYLIVPGRSVSRQAFDGSISDEDITKRSLVHKIYDEHEGWELIARKLKSTKTVGILGAPSSFIKSHGLYTNPTRKRLQSRLLKLEPEIECSYINEQLRDLRVIKQPSEIKAIQKAIDITVESFNDSFNPSLARHYKYEYEIEANITKGIRSRGATGHAYEPIVASGQRACTLHYIDNNGELGKR
jgi:Xaa-Pro aminopeptidase